jgi:tetratricopeptide (TPR) repeat protein
VLSERYVLGAVTGHCATGLVYAALDRKLQREVAVKLLRSVDGESVQRFSREALASGALQHPNVLAVFDAGDEQGFPFLVTELLRGETLQELLSRGPLSPEQARSLAQQIASGLASAHDKGFTHLDLSPASIFITSDGWVKILDFGLASPASSIGYVAPEQARGQPADARADLFNFGLVLYEMLTGHRAFAGETLAAANQLILHEQPRPLPASTPRALRRLIERCLAKDRTERPPTARELLAGLQQPQEAVRLERPPRAGRRLPAAVVLIAAAAAVAIFFAFERRPERLPSLTLPLHGKTVAPAGTVAILPFDARSAPHFTLLAEGVGDVLSRDFEGGSLRAVDTGSVLQAVGQGSTGDLDRASAAAAQLGAKYFILGRVEEKAGQLFIEAVLYDGGSGEPLLQGAAHGNPAEVLRPIRALSDQLQGLTPTLVEFEQRLASLAWRTSSSPEALQAFLEGEHLWRRGSWDKAALPYQRAVEADPQFALAHYRLGKALAGVKPGMAEDELERALRYSDHLSKPERLAVEGHLYLQRGSFKRAEEIFTEATRRYPAEPQAWIELGNVIFEFGPYYGVSPQDALPALQEALVFDPVNTLALSDLIDLAILRNERGTVLKLTDRLLGHTDNPTNLASYGYVRAWARKDPAERKRILLGMHKPGDPPLPRVILAGELAREYPADERRAEAALFTFLRAEWLGDDTDEIEDLVKAITPAASFLPEAEFNLRRGRPLAARRVFAAAKNLSEENVFYASWMNTLAGFELSKDELAEARATAASLESSGKDPDQLPARRYVIGALAARAHDFAAAAKIADNLAAMPRLYESSITTDLALALRARIENEKGNHGAALSLLEQQRLQIPMRYAHFYFWVNESFLRAQLLEKAERWQEALKLYDAIPFDRAADPSFMPLARLHKARINEELGNTEAAFDNYAIFTEVWKNAEPAERSKVAWARKRMEQLPGHRADR